MRAVKLGIVHHVGGAALVQVTAVGLLRVMVGWWALRRVAGGRRIVRRHGRGCSVRIVKVRARLLLMRRTACTTSSARAVGRRRSWPSRLGLARVARRQRVDELIRAHGRLFCLFLTNVNLSLDAYTHDSPHRWEAHTIIHNHYRSSIVTTAHTNRRHGTHKIGHDARIPFRDRKRHHPRVPSDGRRHRFVADGKTGSRWVLP